MPKDIEFKSLGLSRWPNWLAEADFQLPFSTSWHCCETGIAFTATLELVNLWCTGRTAWCKKRQGYQDLQLPSHPHLTFSHQAGSNIYQNPSTALVLTLLATWLHGFTESQALGEQKGVIVDTTRYCLALVAAAYLVHPLTPCVLPCCKETNQTIFLLC